MQIMQTRKPGNEYNNNNDNNNNDNNNNNNNPLFLLLRMVYVASMFHICIRVRSGHVYNRHVMFSIFSRTHVMTFP